MKNIKTYSELILLPTFKERFEYLKLNGVVAEETFAGHRWLNQHFYRSIEWKRFRRRIIVRDAGCDLADPDRQIYGTIIIHHLNPITIEDIMQHQSCVIDEENAICVSTRTHRAIHYGIEAALEEEYKERTKNDTCPWRWR